MVQGHATLSELQSRHDNLMLKLMEAPNGSSQQEELRTEFQRIQKQLQQIK